MRAATRSPYRDRADDTWRSDCANNRCDGRYTTLEAAQRACAAVEWCGSVVRDNGLGCLQADAGGGASSHRRRRPANYTISSTELSNLDARLRQVCARPVGSARRLPTPRAARSGSATRPLNTALLRLRPRSTPRNSHHSNARMRIV